MVKGQLRKDVRKLVDAASAVIDEFWAEGVVIHKRPINRLEKWTKRVEDRLGMVRPTKGD